VITVAVVDDHQLVREGVVRTIGEQADMTVVFAGQSPDQVLLVTPPPRVVLLDLDLGDRVATPADVAAILARGDSDVIVMSALSDPALGREMLHAGVAGICAKRDSTDSLLAGIRAVVAGEAWTSPTVARILLADVGPERPQLSAQELRLVRDYAAGMPLPAVAEKMHISVDTAAGYLKRVRAKYDAIGRDARSKSGLYREALRDGLLSLDDQPPEPGVG
jgi:DNA-binding NarL/FixJ family response regulator